jgi:hypothetical protein
MRRTLLGVALMIIPAMMMGCMDVTPCTDNEDCVIDFGWGDDDRDSAHRWEMPSMECNLEVSPLEACEQMMDYLPPLDWLPFGDWIMIKDCEEVYGDLPEDTGTCETSWGMSWF